VDSCEGALSRVSEGGLQARKEQLLKQIEERKQYFMNLEMESIVGNTGLQLNIATVETQIAKLQQTFTQVKEERRKYDFNSPNNPETPTKVKAQWLKLHFRRKKHPNGRYSDFTRPLLPSST
jgi:hypothetical protein